MEINFESILDKNISEIINGFFALSGVIIGWGLQLISQYGRINVLKNESRIHYLSGNGSGGFKDVRSLYQSERVTLHCMIELYNSSSSNKKTLRNLKVLLVPHNSFFNKIRRNCLEPISLELHNNLNVTINPQELKTITPILPLTKEQAELLDKGKMYFSYQKINDSKKKIPLIKPGLIITPPED
ncbi:hypothetical protein [Galbibacter sp. BG1]